MSQTLAARVWAIPTLPGKIIRCIPLANDAIKFATLSKSTLKEFIFAHGHTITLQRFQDLKRLLVIHLEKLQDHVSHVNLYIHAVRTIDIRGCIPLGIQLAGFPHLVEIFPHVTRIIADTCELVRDTPTSIESSDGNTAFTLFVAFDLTMPDLDISKACNVLLEDLPPTWRVTWRMRLSLVYNDHGDDPLLKRYLSAVQQRDDTAELDFQDYWPFEHLYNLIDALSVRQDADLPPINSLNLQTAVHDVEQLNDLFTAQARSHSHAITFDRLKIDYYDGAITLDVVQRADWARCASLKVLELDVEFEDSPDGYKTGNNIRPTEGTLSSHDDPVDTATSTSISTHTFTGSSFLNLSSCVIHISLTHYSSFGPHQDTLSLVRNLPVVSEVAGTLLKIGGATCHYELAPHAETVASLIQPIASHCTSIKREIQRQITIANTSGGKGWCQVVKDKDKGLEE